MNILITGGAGYIGYSLVRALDSVDEVNEITVYDNLFHSNINFFTHGENLNKTFFVKGDILNAYELEKVVRNQDVVIHLAAHVDFPYSYKDNFRYEQVNQYGTLGLYTLLDKYPPNKVIFLSSAAVYGFRDVKDEQSPTEPTNYYGISKLKGEAYINLLSSKSKVIILRSGNVFGYNPMVRLDAVVNNFMFEALLYGRIKIHGTGTQKRPFIYLPNLVEVIIKNILDNNALSGVQNIVQGNLALNEIRDFLINYVPNLEFTYVNSNSDIPGFEMESNIKTGPDISISMEDAFNEFENVMAIQNSPLSNNKV